MSGLRRFGLNRPDRVGLQPKRCAIPSRRLAPAPAPSAPYSAAHMGRGWQGVGRVLRLGRNLRAGPCGCGECPTGLGWRGLATPSPKCRAGLRWAGRAGGCLGGQALGRAWVCESCAGRGLGPRSAPHSPKQGLPNPPLAAGCLARPTRQGPALRSARSTRATKRVSVLLPTAPTGSGAAARLSASGPHRALSRSYPPPGQSHSGMLSRFKISSKVGRARMTAN